MHNIQCTTTGPSCRGRTPKRRVIFETHFCHSIPHVDYSTVLHIISSLSFDIVFKLRALLRCSHNFCLFTLSNAYTYYMNMCMCYVWYIMYGWVTLQVPTLLNTLREDSSKRKNVIYLAWMTWWTISFIYICLFPVNLRFIQFPHFFDSLICNSIEKKRTSCESWETT